MIILIDTEDKTIEVEGNISAKDTKKKLRLALKEFEEYNYVVFDPIKITFIPIELTTTLDNFLKGINDYPSDTSKRKDIKPGPPKE
jgi:hypothetical protein